jgi:hypothetical protein
LLIIAAVVSLRLVQFGSDLEVEHILCHSTEKYRDRFGGFAGTPVGPTTGACLLTDDWQVVLISETTRSAMLSRWATVLPSHVIAPIRRMVRKTLHRGACLQRRPNRTWCFEGKDTRGSVALSIWSSPVVRANQLVPGMQEHAMPFKLLGDAALRNRVSGKWRKPNWKKNSRQTQSGSGTSLSLVVVAWREVGRYTGLHSSFLSWHYPATAR